MQTHNLTQYILINCGGLTLNHTLFKAVMDNEDITKDCTFLALSLLYCVCVFGVEYPKGTKKNTFIFL